MLSIEANSHKALPMLLEPHSRNQQSINITSLGERRLEVCLCARNERKALGPSLQKPVPTFVHSCRELHEIRSSTRSVLVANTEDKEPQVSMLV